jgi:hypothetical protein
LQNEWWRRLNLMEKFKAPRWTSTCMIIWVGLPDGRDACTWKKCIFRVTFLPQFCLFFTTKLIMLTATKCLTKHTLPKLSLVAGYQIKEGRRGFSFPLLNVTTWRIIQTSPLHCCAFNTMASYPKLYILLNLSFKNQLYVSSIMCIVIFRLNFIDFCLSLYYFFLPTAFGFSLLCFFRELEVYH